MYLWQFCGVGLSENMVKMRKNVENALLWCQKNEKMADFCGVAGIFVPKRAFFLQKNAPKWGGRLLRLSFTGKVYEFGALCQILVYF